jgi:hypothetical protein
MHKTKFSVIGLALLGILVLAMAAPAYAHEKRTVTGPNGVAWNMRVGSQVEPPYTDFPNAAQMFMTRTVVVNGANQTVPVLGLQNYLKVNISTGGHTVTMPLKTVSSDPTQYIAAFIPTVAGTYIYTYFGNINGTNFNQSFNCSNGFFECVSDPSAIEFPAKTPTGYQLENQLNSINATVLAASGQATSGNMVSNNAYSIALAGVAVGVLSLLLAVVALARRGTKA